MKRIGSYLLTLVLGISVESVTNIGDSIQYAATMLMMRENPEFEGTLSSADGNFYVDADGWVHCPGLVLDPQPVGSLKVDRGSVMMVESPISLQWVDDYGNSHQDELVPLENLPEGSEAHVIISFNGVKYAPTGDFLQ